MHQNTLQVEETIKEIQQIRESIDDLAKIEDKSFLKRYGVQIADSSDSESATDLSSGEEDSLASQEDSLASSLELDGLIPQAHRNLTSQADYNFFHLLDISKLTDNKAESLYQSALEALESTDPKVDIFKHSFAAYQNAMKESSNQERIARAVNGEVVSESEDFDSADAYIYAKDLGSKKVTTLIAKK